MSNCTCFYPKITSDLDNSTRTLNTFIILNGYISWTNAHIRSLIQQLIFNDTVEIILYIAGLILSAVLVALSIFAYLQSRLKKLE